MKQRTVLITGGAGFVGSHIIEYFLAKTDFNLVSIDSYSHMGDSLRNVRNPRVRYLCHDLSAPISDRLRERIGKVDYIVNCASQSHVDRSIAEPVDFIKNNVALILNVLEYARKVKPKKFIQVSTDEVCGPALKHESHKEHSTHFPSNPYAASKAAQENICYSYWRTYGVPIIFTRTMNMIGERQDKEKFLPLIISCIKDGNILFIHGDETGMKTGSRYYLHAKGYADAVLFILKNVKVRNYRHSEANHVHPKMFNVVGEREVTNLELSKMVEKEMKGELKYKIIDFHSVRPGHDLRYALDGSAMKKLGWVNPFPLNKAIKQIIRFSNNKKNKGWI